MSFAFVSVLREASGRHKFQLTDTMRLTVITGTRAFTSAECGDRFRTAIAVYLDDFRVPAAVYSPTITPATLPGAIVATFNVEVAQLTVGSHMLYAHAWCEPADSDMPGWEDSVHMADGHPGSHSSALAAPTFATHTLIFDVKPASIHVTRLDPAFLVVRLVGLPHGVAELCVSTFFVPKAAAAASAEPHRAYGDVHCAPVIRPDLKKVGKRGCGDEPVLCKVWECIARSLLGVNAKVPWAACRMVHSV